jgi:hypothetical protein
MLRRKVHTCRILCIDILWMYYKGLGDLLDFVNNVEKLKIHHRILPQNVLPGAQHKKETTKGLHFAEN